MKKRVVKSSGAGNETAGTVQRRKPLYQVHSEGYDAGIRHSVEALLGQGKSRHDIAKAFICQDIPFPFTNDPAWHGAWTFET